MLGAKSHDQLLVRLLLARFVKDAHVGLAAIEGLAGFSKPASEAVVDECDLEGSLERVEHAHLAFCSIGGDLDLLGLGDGGILLVLSIRL